MQQTSATHDLPRGSERILLVDDDEGVRFAVGRLLEALGYETLVASDAEQARDHFSEHCPIDLLISDIVMPGVNGVDLSNQLHSQDHDLRVLLISGYTNGALSESSSFRFLRKPFSMRELALVIREMLDS